MTPSFVTPAKAGAQLPHCPVRGAAAMSLGYGRRWVPAFAGMTEEMEASAP